MSGNKNSLDIFFGQKKIAELHLKNDQLLWEYTLEWQQNGFAVSPYLPLNNEFDVVNTQIFLRNMLPEGHAFEELTAYFNLSRNNTFALIRVLGLDIPGALVMLPSDSTLPTDAVFRIIDQAELERRLEHRDEFNLFIWDEKPRISSAGIQDKLNVIVNEKDQLGFGEGKLCSTHILKFEKHQLLHLVLNEYVTMQLAKECGLEVADTKILHFGKNPALLVKRFDRRFKSNLEVQRRHIIDGCQALNLPPEYKYERNLGSGRDVAHIRDGANYAKLFEFAEKCSNPALTKQKILDWALFNVLIFNFDAHAKNISFIVGKDGISLAPFYDLVNVKMYPNFHQEMAMAIGDEFDGAKINSYQIIEFAQSCNLSRMFIATRLQNIADKILERIKYIFDSIRTTNEAEKEYLAKYYNMVSKRCEYFMQKLTEIKTLELD